ncbi:MULTISPECIES: tRNA (guanosine(46)-N7)-methyltransferase TrmB [Fusobacterium]|uniref:tRNA (guanosine(46)-N7)-methyltransferase TrmB n=1 Tax=Fusobacterium TaxID=848 RepID=UPI001476E652|nr:MULTISPECIES: tRNA (guanosine(46)-N7)-methyltransferase TrmB [Fusobacterium]NME36078.1 tRNA (guanosine(46)-N7)-methyltransferase TrmB [Fusobacterium sp. FSA-380-WT-3A]
MKEIKEKEYWEHFFEKPKKHYNPYMERLKEFPEYIMYDSDLMDSYKNRWNEFFGNNNPIYIEIGSGSGNFAIGMCQKYPERNHMAMELRFKRLHSSARKSKNFNLKNVVFLRRFGEQILDFIGEGEIQGMYINFPDPWEGNEKNRIIQKPLFETLDKVLKVGGKLFFKTDHDQYYLDVLELSKELENYKVVYHTNDLHKSEKAIDNVLTEFEQLFLNKFNKNINYIEIEKIK